MPPGEILPVLHGPHYVFGVAINLRDLDLALAAGLHCENTVTFHLPFSFLKKGGPEARPVGGAISGSRR
jgi:hypothetical protein